MVGNLQARRDVGDDLSRDLVLDVEYVRQFPVVAFGPQVIAGHRIDQLGGDADSVPGPAHAALDDIAHAKLAADLADIDSAAFECKSVIARDHEQGPEAGKFGDDVL